MQFLAARAQLEVITQAGIQDNTVAKGMLDLDIGIGTGLLAGIQDFGIVVGLQDKIVLDALQIGGIGQIEAVGLPTDHDDAGLRLAKRVVVTALCRNAVGVFTPFYALEHVIIELDQDTVRAIGIQVVSAGSAFRNVTVHLVTLLVLGVEIGRNLPGKISAAVCIAQFGMLR